MNQHISSYFNTKAAITHNEISESLAIAARKTITVVIVTMSLKRFSAVCPT